MCNPILCNRDINDSIYMSENPLVLVADVVYSEITVLKFK